MIGRLCWSIFVLYFDRIFEVLRRAVLTVSTKDVAKIMVVYVVKSLYINFDTLDQMHLNFFLVHLGSYRKNILVRNPGKPKLKKIKNPPRKNFLYFRKWNFLVPRLFTFQLILSGLSPQNFSLKKFLIFSQKKTFSYISGNRTFLYFRKQNFLALRLKISKGNCTSSKNFAYFVKWNFLVPSLKNFLSFRKELAKPENKTFLIFLLKFFVCLERTCWEKNKCKRKTFLLLSFIKNN